MEALLVPLLMGNVLMGKILLMGNLVLDAAQCGIHVAQQFLLGA